MFAGVQCEVQLVESGGGLVKPGGSLSDSPVQPLDSPSVAMPCAVATRLQGRACSGFQILIMVVVAHTTLTL